MSHVTLRFLCSQIRIVFLLQIDSTHGKCLKWHRLLLLKYPKLLIWLHHLLALPSLFAIWIDYKFPSLVARLRKINIYQPFSAREKKGSFGQQDASLTLNFSVPFSSSLHPTVSCSHWGSVNSRGVINIAVCKNTTQLQTQRDPRVTLRRRSAGFACFVFYI